MSLLFWNISTEGPKYAALPVNSTAQQPVFCWQVLCIAYSRPNCVCIVGPLAALLLKVL